MLKNSTNNKSLNSKSLNGKSYKTKLSALLLATINMNSFAAVNQCREVGGMGLAEAIDETNLVTALSGDFTGAWAKILGLTESSL